MEKSSEKLSKNSRKAKDPVSPRKKIKISYENGDSDGSSGHDLKDSSDKGPQSQPKNWKALVNGMREMRKTHPAPVDTMGANSCHDESAPEKTQRFQKLVALLLSSQTKDEITHAACMRLQKFGFTPDHLSRADVGDIEDVLKPVGFYKTKAKHLKNTSQILVDDYDSDIPRTVESLISLPGIGPKMAHICMRTAWNEITGIGVDTHVHRISNRWKFVKKPTKTPEDTRKALEDWLPRKYWDDITLLMVGFGQTICTPKNPKCKDCVNNEICPNAFKESSR